ncbi:MAG: hypothetical protein OXG25_10070 [Gammaproteobacteria bacterium]|nr:hypothetical protein [Gammaproteobacteria bacterium]
MTHSIKFYPVGNGDCSQIILSNGKRLLFDFCHRRKSEDVEDPRIDLHRILSAELSAAKKSGFDVVALTHLDDDHIANSTEFFYLEHAKKYQQGDRTTIDELWVPAATILEKGLSGEAAIWRREARHRLIAGKGIRVFSKPSALKDWLESNGLSLSSREHLITDAGQLVPGFTLADDGVEFFVHSPFAKHSEGELVLRNESALILHATFMVSDTKTRYLLVGDSTWEILEEIVDITSVKGNEERLYWDIYNVPHHCSYLALGPEKGKTQTDPVENVQWLLDQCQSGAIAVSSSEPIPKEDTIDPPHRQAAATYEQAIQKNGGSKFVVTMEHPNEKKPKVLEVEISRWGAKLLILSSVGSASMTKSRSTRAGSHGLV